MRGSTDVPSVEQRLRALEDRNAILDLEAGYAVRWDTNEPQRWAGLFTEDGVFEMKAAGDTPPMRIEGRDALREFCRGINERWTGMHYLHPPQLEIDGDTARATVFFEYRYLHRGGAAHTRQGSVSGYYRVTYLRTPQGWRMRERIEKAVMAASGSFYDIGA